MTRTDIAKALRRYCGRETIKLHEIAGFLGDSNKGRVKRKYCAGLEAIGGQAYLVTEIAEKMKDSCELK